MFRCLLFVFFIAKAGAQSYQAPAFLGIGNTAAGHSGIYSLWANPAGIADVKRVSFAAAYQQIFLSSDIHALAAYGALPLGKYGALGIHHLDWGSRHTMREAISGITLANSIGKHWRVALGTRYHRTIWAESFREAFVTADFNSAPRLLFDAGLQYAQGHLTIGGFYKQIGEMALGFAYLFSEQVYLATDVFVERGERLDLRTGLEYRPQTHYRIRGGISSNPLQYYLGAGLQGKHLQVDIASAIHRELGLSPQIGLSYAF